MRDIFHKILVSGERVWIGGKKESGKWEWKDGKPFDEYTNWNVREPSGDGVYMEMYSNGKWNDVGSTSSSYANRVVCQGLYVKIRYLIYYSLR